MSNIKYVDNKNIQYGEDGHLKSNWNSDTDYKNEYANVHFRIEAEYYQYPYTDYTQEQKNDFYNEVGSIFESLGWDIEKENKGGYCMEIKKGKQHLYLHPQDFSGEVLKNEIKKIAEALNKNNTFNLRWVDIYETVYDISDEEYENYLNGKYEEIRKLLFENCQTKRTSKYYQVFDMCRVIANKIRLVRIGLNDSRNYGIGQTIEFIKGVVDDMVVEGLLISAKNNELIRSLNKTEQKKLKINIA